MRGLALWFMASAIVYVIAGMCFGIYMAVNQDFALAPAHGHLNLIGWVSMALFGIYYHLAPRAAETQLAKLHFAVATLTIWMMVPGIRHGASSAGRNAGHRNDADLHGSGVAQQGDRNRLTLKAP